MKQRLISLAMAAILLLGLPTLAVAANVSANCTTSGGIFSTYGHADNWQDHVHDGILWHTWYTGRQFKSHSWGMEYGLETGTVNGPNLSGAGANCLI